MRTAKSKPGSKPAVNFSRQKSLLIRYMRSEILKSIKAGMKPYQIVSFLSHKTGQNWTKQRLNKHFTALKGQNLIDEKRNITARGKLFLAGCEGGPNFDQHNLIISFAVRSRGRLPEGNIPMTNWTYRRMDFGAFEVRVHYARETRVKIYLPKEYGENSIDCALGGGMILERILLLLEKNYGCEIDRKTREIDRNAHYHPLNDKTLKALGDRLDAGNVRYDGDVLAVDKSGPSPDIKQDWVGNYENLVKDYPNMMSTLGGVRADQTRILNLFMVMGEILKNVQDVLKELKGAKE